MQRFKNILCIVEPRVVRKLAVERAVALAENNQANLTVVDVIESITAGIRMPEGGPISADLQAAMVSSHLQELETMVDPYRKRTQIQTKVLKGTHFLEIIREVLRSGHDLVIKTAESSGMLEYMFGSDDMHLLRKCPCPVWLIESKSPKVYHRILAAVDVDDNYPPEELNTRHLLNLQIIEMASSMALTEFADLHIVHAWAAVGESAMRGAFMERPEEEVVAYVEKVRQRHKQNLSALMDEIVSNLERKTLDYLKLKTHLLHGSPRKEIPAFAEGINADLVVMGTVARTGIPGFFMGNTAETILNRLDCSVLAIKPPGFETPVTLED
jgi:nucleotide-binding universal stress UspA family protein